MISARIKQLCFQLEKEFDQIPSERKQLLQQLADALQQKKNVEAPLRLIYVCTHNSRRSHLGQIWANVAANFYGIDDVETFSAGTEATAIHPNTLEALRHQGFEVMVQDHSANPTVEIRFGTTELSKCFSKTIDDASLPKDAFIAVMTCSDADENCPFIPGCDLRIGTTYEDPKKSDGTPEQTQTYMNRSLQIGRECLYVFSLLQ